MLLFLVSLSHTHNGFTTTPTDRGLLGVCKVGLHQDCMPHTNPRDCYPTHITSGTHLNIPSNTVHHPQSAAVLMPSQQRHPHQGQYQQGVIHHGVSHDVATRTTPDSLRTVIPNPYVEMQPTPYVEMEPMPYFNHGRSTHSPTYVGLDVEINQHTERCNIQSLGDIDVRLESLNE